MVKIAPEVDPTSDLYEAPWPEWTDSFINNMKWNLKYQKPLSSPTSQLSVHAQVCC